MHRCNFLAPAKVLADLKHVAHGYTVRLALPLSFVHGISTPRPHIPRVDFTSARMVACTYVVVLHQVFWLAGYLEKRRKARQVCTST
jgi:hypothetical protein